MRQLLWNYNKLKTVSIIILITKFGIDSVYVTSHRPILTALHCRNSGHRFFSMDNFSFNRFHCFFFFPHLKGCSWVYWIEPSLVLDSIAYSSAKMPSSSSKLAPTVVHSFVRICITWESESLPSSTGVFCYMTLCIVFASEYQGCSIVHIDLFQRLCRMLYKHQNNSM